jgi:hypothetical protein
MNYLRSKLVFHSFGVLKYRNYNKGKPFEGIKSWFNLTEGKDHILVEQMKNHLNETVNNISGVVMKELSKKFDRKLEFKEIHHSKTSTKFTNYSFEFEVKIGDGEEIGIVQAEADFNGKDIEIQHITLITEDGVHHHFE